MYRKSDLFTRERTKSIDQVNDHVLSESEESVVGNVCVCVCVCEYKYFLVFQLNDADEKEDTHKCTLIIPSPSYKLGSYITEVSQFGRAMVNAFKCVLIHVKKKCCCNIWNIFFVFRRAC